MPGQLIQLGPWGAGLNTTADPEFIETNELSVCNNFDINDDGHLLPRRGQQIIATPKYNGECYPVGDYYESTGKVRRVLVKDTRTNAVPLGTDVIKTYFVYDGIGGTQQLDVTTNDAALQTAGVTQVRGANRNLLGGDSSFTYNGFMYVCPNSGSTATWKFDTNSFAKVVSVWTPSFAGTTAPNGFTAIGVFKSRAFVYNKNRIYYSAATDMTDFTTASGHGGFFDIGDYGDGPINVAIFTRDKLVIFKTNSTYTFQWNLDPGVDGVVRRVSSDQGATSAILYQNLVYCVNSKSVFKFTNDYFYDIAAKLNISTNYNLSGLLSTCMIIDQTLIISYAANTSGTSNPTNNLSTSFALNLQTGAFSTYTGQFMAVSGTTGLAYPVGYFTNYNGFITPAFSLPQGGLATFDYSRQSVYDQVCARYANGSLNTPDFTNTSGYNYAVWSIQVPHTIETKNYDQFSFKRRLIGSAFSWKRLLNWNFEGSMADAINSTVDQTGRIGWYVRINYRYRQSYQYRTAPIGYTIPGLVADLVENDLAGSTVDVNQPTTSTTYGKAPVRSTSSRIATKSARFKTIIFGFSDDISVNTIYGNAGSGYNTLIWSTQDFTISPRDQTYVAAPDIRSIGVYIAAKREVNT